MSIGYRKKGDNGPLYNPERDYAYITPTLMRVAIETLDANDSVEKADWRKTQNITESEVVAVVEALANAQRDFVNGADPVSSFENALMRHNFFSSRYCVRQFLFATLGEVFCAAWFKAVREVSIVGEESPAQDDMARFVAAVREFVNKSRSVTYDASFMVERLRMMNDVLRAREEDMRANLRAAAADLSAHINEIQRLKTELNKPGFWAKLLSLFRKKKRNAKV